MRRPWCKYSVLNYPVLSLSSLHKNCSPDDKMQSWSQVAAETMRADSLIVGVDLAPIKPIPRVITFQGDITTDKCCATIRKHLKTWKADTVLHDGAPNVGTAWVQDSYNQAELVLQSMKLATDFLVEGGTFVTKVFRSKDYNSLLWVFNQLFARVEATKPPSSRNVSAEIFVVCRGFKAPKRIDPRFLDSKSVFAELKDPSPNNEARVYNPESKKRKRDGYEEGDYIQFKEVPASKFIDTADPIAVLGSCNKLSFSQKGLEDVALAALDRLPETTPDIREACSDLKVLGRKEFKMLLKWRLKAREVFGLAHKSATPKPVLDEVAHIEDMDEELKIQEELQAMKDREDAHNKRERRKENAKKRKDIVRMQLNMAVPMDIGMEQAGPMGQGSMFALQSVDRAGVKRIVNGKMAVIAETENKQGHNNDRFEPDSSSDDDGDDLEGQLEVMYNDYRERRAAADAKYRAKRTRKNYDDEEWEGVSAAEQEEESSSEGPGDDSVSEPEDETTPEKLITDLDGSASVTSGLSKRASGFFSRDIFKGIVESDENDVRADEEEEEDAVRTETDHAERVPSDLNDGVSTLPQNEAAQAEEELKAFGGFDSSDDDGIEVIQKDFEDDEWEDEKRHPDGKLNIDIITTEAMTLAQQLASGQKTAASAIDDGFNKHAFRDRDGLPEWFLDDESKHDKPQKPITKAAAQAIKEKLRALNARPIKKVREAKARKKLKAAQRLEKLRKKSDMLAAEEGITEKEKASGIQKMLARAARKKPRKDVKLVVARGVNRGVQGRPRGVKGRYKIVDARMKKDMRGLKRAAVKAKKR